MRRGRPVPQFVLNPTERTTLEQYARRPTTAQALALRARIVLRCATGARQTAMAAELGVTLQTVGKWRTRFVAHRIAGLPMSRVPVHPAKLPMHELNGRSPRRWSRRRAMRPTGAPANWRNTRA